ncbi:N-acetylmuramoyl-L-alanine amidase [Clostridium sp. ZS2-4]|uniref:N-acetylmuramoyl-L-alanine amidase n=1 Tax=Clostridium sp. ZS2-4 TaxID=2987703 RepID=UPI00227A990D|nr:N-acetylmuramoyl-L-alanine amidase [Clostridium sp. ZS2-4]MCY6355601.1 N-acetylmuramoyl-L-alanine amidase [Clostridium sp. ZS2-4]
MGTIRKIAMFMVMILVIGVSLPPNVFASTYLEMESKINIDIDKVWTINFSDEVDKSSIDGKDTIVVLNDSNSKVDTKIDYKDNKSVRISAVNGYEYGKTYTLLVKEGIKSVKGSELSKPTKMIFTTKTNPDKPAGQKGYIVALDAGRAANDIGAEVGPSGVKGKDINLDVVLKAGKILEENGVKVVYTRKTDTVSWSSGDSISRRSKIVNDAKADVLVSVHCNSSTAPTATGSETYYLKGNNESKKLASYVQNELASKTNLHNRGIKESTYKTLSSVSATGIYVDLGFITNQQEEKIMNSEEFKKNSAAAIAVAVLKYLDVKQSMYIKDIKDITTLLYQGEKYTLPTTVKAVMSDNTDKSVSVKWDKATVNTSKIGTYYYKGTVSGYSGTVTLKVIVNKAPNTDISKITKVCIDASSASNLKVLNGTAGVKDKDVNLAIALKLGKILESKGIKVTYTRNTDSVSWNQDVDVDKRTQIANDSGAEALISLHCNYYNESVGEGIETYYSPSDSASKKLAENVQKNVIFNTNAKDRGAKESSNFKMLENFDEIGIMVYYGFISNPKEEILLNTSEYQEKIVNGIAQSVVSYSNSSVNDTIISANDVRVNVKQGEQYFLPTKISAVNSNNAVVQADVIWEVNSIDTSKLGSYVIQGRVKNYNKPVTLTVVVSIDGTPEYKICIDPGHGGYDSGAVGPGGTKEKDVVLAVALEVGDILVKNGIDVVYTRTSDNVPWPANKSAELKMRCDISDTANVNYFVSIHANSIDGSPSTSGIETLYGNNRSDGIKLAQNIQDELVAATGGKDRGLKERGVYVVKYTKAPSALVELEFLSNTEKEKLLKSPQYQQKSAEAIARGIMKTLD